MQVLKNQTFLGTVGPRTIFQISTTQGADISLFSSMAEEEVLLPPATVLRVIGTLDLGHGLTMVQCEDDTEAPCLME
jgi:hypothetical protein